MTNFVSLHNQTDYSILDSIISTKSLFLKAKELNQPAVAITDHGTLASAWEALKASKETGVKLIMGCECYFVNDAANITDKFRHLILLAKNAVGYKNLLAINKEGFDQGSYTGKKVYPVVDWNLLEKHTEGLICLTACGNGIISQLLMSKKFDEATEVLLKLKALFGDNLGIEVQPNNMKRNANIYNEEIDQQFLNAKLISLGKQHNIKIVPACNAHYLEKDDADIHDLLLAIGSHQPKHSNFRLKYKVPDFYLKSGDEVKTFFSRNHGEEFASQLCENTIYFADLCEQPDWIDPKYSNPSGKELPDFPVKDQLDYQEFLTWAHESYYDKTLEEDKLYLRFKCEQVFLLKSPEDKLPEYRARLEEELDVIYYCGITSYMLIVADYIKWCRDNNVSVGAGRGSVGGCFVAFLLDIHLADPIKYDLVFERFFNKLKKDYGDIDSDFSKNDRDKVIAYIINKYGKDNVAQISNVIKMTPKVYARDISRACELGGSKEAAVIVGNEVADTIPADIRDIDEAFAKVPLLNEYASKYPEFKKYAKIANCQRAAGMHAAGVIISKRPLHEIVPIRKDKSGATVIEYDKVLAEENGLVKMDILGLNTLDIISTTNAIINSRGFPTPVIDYDKYDWKTYDLISRGDTFGVFQFGTSAGTIDLCKKIKPKSIEDLAVITTLARPASKEIRDDFVKTKNGKKEVDLAHPSLGRAFAKTYGFPLYDESLLILANDVAGWDLAEADKLRKLTKEKGKNPAKVKKWKEEFIEGAIKNNITQDDSNRIWETIIEPFGKYSFNKSHAVLYSMISFHTAFLKAHFPIEFLLANLMSEVNSNAPDAPGNVAKIKKEIRRYKVKILPPNINTSQLAYTLLDTNELLTGLDALKFVGDDAIKDIIEKRPFKSFFDFMARVDFKKVRANSIQALAAAGALDSFNIPRKLMFLYCSDFRKKLQIWLKKHDPSTEEFFYPWPENSEWVLSELYALEYSYLGDSFTCKPPEAYGKFFEKAEHSLGKLKKSKEKLYGVKAIIKELFEFKVKKETSKFYGQAMVKAVIEDQNGDQCSCTIFPDSWSTILKKIKFYNSKLIFEPGLAVEFNASVNVYEDEIGLILEDVRGVQGIPAKPADLKAQKVSLKEAKSKKSNLIDSASIIEEIEDSLFEDGLIDLDNEDL